MKQPSKPGELLTTGPGDRELAPVSNVDLLAEIPEPDAWLANQRSERTARAYRRDVRDFVTKLGIRDLPELARADHKAVITWRKLCKDRGDADATVRVRLSALSSLFKHLVEHGVANRNPVRDVQRPKIDRKNGKTPSFSAEQARLLMDSPDPETLVGVRDRAILAVGFQVGPRRAEIAHLTVGDFGMDNGVACLRFRRKGSDDAGGWVGTHPETVKRVREYLEKAGHGGDPHEALFLPVRGNQRTNLQNPARHLDPWAIDRILRRYARKVLGVDARGFSAHSMRATFITRALENGAEVDAVQYAAGHAHTSTTLLYDRRKQKPERSASFFASY